MPNSFHVVRLFIAVNFTVNGIREMRLDQLGVPQSNAPYA